LSNHIQEAKKIDAVLDLLGNTVMLDSLAMLRRVFRFEEIREAHRIMEANEANGKMVVVHA
jgi:hypothetical protein